MSSGPVFPTEVSILFLDFLSPLSLWSSHRLVCRTWRHYIEHILAPTRWLPEFCILCDGGWQRDEVGNWVLMCLRFRWRGFADRCAVSPQFTSTTSHDPIHMDALKQSRQRIPCPTPRKELVQFTDIRIHPDFIPLARRTCAARTLDIAFLGEINDMRIPELSIDWETVTVTCGWRELIVAFFREENEVQRRFAEEKRMRQALGVGSSPLWIGIGAGGARKVATNRGAEELLEASVYEVVRNERLERLGWRDEAGHERLHRKRIALRYIEKHGLPAEPPPPSDEDIPARLSGSHGSSFLRPGSFTGGISPGTSPTTTYVGSMPNTHSFPSSDTTPSLGYLGRDKKRISNKRTSSSSRSRKSRTDFAAATPSSHM